LPGQVQEDPEHRQLLSRAVVQHAGLAMAAPELDAADAFSGYLDTLTEDMGQLHGRAACSRLFSDPDIVERNPDQWLDEASELITRIYHHIPASAFTDLPAKQLYARGVRRALAFVATAAAKGQVQGTGGQTISYF
jgi:hypothetical protein